MNNRSSKFLLILFLLVSALLLYRADSGYCQESASPQAPAALPSQQAIQSELQKAGITLTPDEIQKGKEMLQKMDKPAVLPPAEKNEKTPQPEVKQLEAALPDIDSETSLFNRTRRISKYQDIDVNLKPFGYQFFTESAARIITERKDVPVPLNYVIGAGDQVNILLWGRMNAQHALTVDRDGKINIPQIGPVYVSGMTFEQMSKHLIAKAEQIVGTNIDITIGSTRAIPIFVLGDVRKPGAYTIGAQATITDALILARGPSDIGSMRRIELRRKDKIIKHYDLYDLFLRGDKSQDAGLQAGDVVFVPVTGPQVGIAGNVKRPAIYELKNKFDLQYLIELAGGMIPSAYTQQMQVERIVKNERQIIIDINDKTLSLVKDFVIQDADLVKVFSIVDFNENLISLVGNVKRPGKYAFKPGMTIKDLVKSPEDLQPATYFEYALIKRRTPPGKAIVLIPFHLGKLLLHGDSAFDYALTPGDQIFIFNDSLFKESPFVIVQGEIRGGSTDPSQDAVRIDQEDKARDKDVLAELGSIKGELGKNERYYLYVSQIEEIEDEIIGEKRPTPGALSYLQVELEKIGRTDITARLKKLERKMQVSRRLNLAGNMKIKDAVLEAGGLTPNASLEEGQIIRQHAKNEFKTKYFNVARAMADDPRDNLILQDGDQIIIHSIWEKNPKKSVFVAGDVTHPGVYQFTDKMTVRDLVFKAGSVLDSAYLDEAEVTSIKIVDGKLGQLAHRTINLRKALEGDAANNIQLAPSDRLHVKQIADYQKVRVVTLSGQISFPGKYPFRKGERLSDIIERAGGFTRHAYLRGAYFTRTRVKDLQQKGLEEMTDRMERELLSAGAEQISTALSQQEIDAKRVEMGQKQRFIQTLRQTRATGRMTIFVADAKHLKNTEYDFEMEDGDTLNIPEKNSVVNVLGSVMTQGSHLYSDSLNYQDYIDATGGYSNYADTGNVFILKVDGSARKVSKKYLGWSASHSRWEMKAYGGEVRQIEPGDTIVVPEKTERIAWLREIKDITQILMNIAVVAAVTIALF